MATRIVRRLMNTLRRTRRDQDLSEELAFHIDKRADDLAARGLSRTEATRQARLEFGGLEKHKEQCREVRGLRLVEDLGRDFAHAARSLGRSPGLVLTSVLSVALGVGVNTTLFSAVSSIFLYQPTATDPERLFWVDPGNSNQFSYLNYRDLRDRKIFADAFGYRPAQLSLRSGAASEGVRAMAVTNNFFQGLGVSARRGRTFTVEETNPRVAVLSHRFWTKRFGGDPLLPGKVITFNGQPFVVLGVLPEAYRPVVMLVDPDVYVPVSDLALPNLGTRENVNALNVVARLNPGTTPEQAQAAATAFGQDEERAYPEQNAGMSRPARLAPFGRMTFASAPLAATVFPAILATLCGLVLLNACANVAGLLLARAAGRQREIALQAALGANRWQLVRPLLAESFLLAFLGTAGGVLLTVVLVPALRDLALPTVGTIHLPMQPDLLLVGYASVLVLITGTVCGLMPALRATKKEIIGQLHRGGGHGATARLWTRHSLVVAQVAASVVLLTISLLFLRTLLRLTTLATGADVEHGIVAAVQLQPNRYTNEERVLATERVLERLNATPGIRSSSFADILPRGMDVSAARFETQGGVGAGARTFLNSVGPRYFETMGIALRRGREFQPADRVGAPPVVIVSQAFAAAYFPGDEPIGKHVRAGRDAYAEIVGVVQDSNYQFIGETPSPLLYYSYAQRPVSTQYRPLLIHARTLGPAAASVRTVSDIVADLDRDAPVRVSTLWDATNFEFEVRRIGSLLLGSLGGLGLLLATVGLYGTISYMVSSKTTEIGIRMALGAPSAAVRWGVLRHGVRLTAAGLAIGIAMSLVAGWLLRALLAGLSPADPVALGGSAVLLTLVALCASYLPARRATKVDPLVALRCE